MSLGRAFELLIALGLLLVFVHNFFYALPWYVPTLLIVFIAALLVVLVARRVHK